MFFSDKISKIPYWINNNLEYFTKDIQKEEIIVDIDEDIPVITSSSCFSLCPTKYKNFEDEKPSSQPMRIEPKTFFANERTYLQWFNGAVLMSSIGLGILSTGKKEIGIILNIFSFLILLYASYIYKKRNYALKHKIAINYQDEFGPYFLTFGIVFSFLLSLLF